MQRDISVTIGIIGLILVVSIFAISSSQNTSLKLSENNAIPNTFVLGENDTNKQQLITPTASATPPLLKSPAVTVTPTVTPSKMPTPTETKTQQFTCNTNSVVQKSKVLANQFMNKHKTKDISVLNLLSAPESQDDRESLDSWLGTDIDNSPRLYATTSTIYKTVDFEFAGSLIDKGNHLEIRGTRRCQQTVIEKRRVETPDTPFSEESVTRYLNFSLAEDGTLILTGFSKDQNGTKYTGFN
ncbi:hypothetical protein IT418_03585 [bacterium]|nr:hypothetical protein [bacterium]